MAFAVLYLLEVSHVAMPTLRGGASTRGKSLEAGVFEVILEAICHARALFGGQVNFQAQLCTGTEVAQSIESCLPAP